MDYDDTFLKCYTDALQLFNSVTPWRGSSDRPWAKRTHNTKRMRMLDDRSIEFEYQGHVFVTWHPDNTLTAEPFSSPQQQEVWARMLPSSTRYDLQCRTGSTVMVCPADQVRQSQWWWRRFPFYVRKNGAALDKYGRSPYGERMANPDVMVFKADQSVRMHYCAERGMWWPVDEAALQPFEWSEIDKKRTRKINEEYRLTDFDGFLKTLTKLVDDAMPAWGGEIPDTELLEIIKSGDFQKAMAHFPRADMRYISRALRNNPNYLDDKLPMYSYFSKLRTRLYKAHNALIERSERVLTLPQFQKVKGLLYRFED